MRNLILGVLFLLHAAAHGQCDSSWREGLSDHWAHLDAEYADSTTSPLTAADRARFTHLAHFAFDSTYCVQAVFTPVPDAKPFSMKTSTTRTPVFKVYGTLRFALNGAERALNVYVNEPPDPRYPDYVFLPFTDLTNGDETYGVGRYLDLQIPLDPVIALDFNKAYNPYCAYSDGYSCPVPPRENHLTTHVRAGVLKYHE